MRIFLLALCFLIAGALDSAAQPLARVEFGPVVRVDRIFIEHGAGGTQTAAGIAAAFRFGPRYGLAAELTHTSAHISRAYSGYFISYTPTPAPSHEEFVRFAPLVQRTLGYDAGVGYSVAFVARGRLTDRVAIAARAGVSVRRYVETSHNDILEIPDGVDPARVARDFIDERFVRTRGGFLFGVDLDVPIGERFHLQPDGRFVWSGPARLSMTHRELGAGLRGVWTW